MTTAAIYCRISLDELGTGKGVQRQLEDARQLAQQRGWEIAAEYTDNDVSAYNGNARKDYKRLMADAEAGKFQHIIVWQTSRLWRDRRERADAIETLTKARIGIAACKGPDLDLSNASGRLVADLLGSLDTAESAIKGERVARAAQQRAEEGRPTSKVPYGWARLYADGGGRRGGFHDEVDEREASVVREIVQRLLAGDTLNAIARSLNERGEPTPGGRLGARWQHNIVHQIAVRPVNVSRRTHHGAVVVSGDWPAIIDDDSHDRVVALLGDPRRKTTRDGRRKHLLSYGIGQCGSCGSQLKVSGANGPYKCVRGACVERSRTAVDAYVAEAVVARLTLPDAASVFDHDNAAAGAARERAEVLRARLEGAADAYASGDISVQQFKRVSLKLRGDLEAADAELARHRRPALPAEVGELMGPRAAEVWAAWTPQQQRSALAAMGVTVVIHPLPGPKLGRSRAFDRDLVEFRVAP